MIEFDSETMSIANVKRKFYVEGGAYGVVDINEIGGDECETIPRMVGSECWVINSVKCGRFDDNDFVFVYFPDLEFATPVIKEFIEIK